MSVAKGHIMEAIPDGFVSIQIHMPPQVLEDLRAAACRSGLTIEDWLTGLLARGAAPELKRRRV
jgi:hypothetical protein